MTIIKFLTHIIIFLGFYLSSVDIIGKEPSKNSPEGLIKSIYSKHSEKTSIDLCNPKNTELYFDKRLSQLIAKDCKCKSDSGEVCDLDFDPFIGGQDFLEPNIKPKIKKVNATTFKVRIYKSKPITLVYKIIKTKEGYRISDIKQKETSLIKTLQKPSTSSSDVKKQ